MDQEGGRGHRPQHRIHGHRLRRVRERPPPLAVRALPKIRHREAKILQVSNKGGRCELEVLLLLEAEDNIMAL